MSIVGKNYPGWANTKQIEGMGLFLAVLSEYLWSMDIEFKESPFGDGGIKNDSELDSRFLAVVSWEKLEKGKRQCEFDIAFDYEATWSHLHERIHEWQFLFSGGDAAREMTNEILFMVLFEYMDEAGVT